MSLSHLCDLMSRIAYLSLDKYGYGKTLNKSVKCTRIAHVVHFGRLVMNKVIFGTGIQINVNILSDK